MPHGATWPCTFGDWEVKIAFSRKLTGVLFPGLCMTVAVFAVPAYAESAVSWAEIPVTAAAELGLEEINEEIYAKLMSGEIVVQNRTTAKGLTGVHIAAIMAIDARTRQIWDVLVDCELQTTFMPGFEECRKVVPKVPIPDGENWMYNRFASRVGLVSLRFEYVVQNRYQPPYQLWWRRVEGDMKLNQGYWRLIHLAGKHHILVLDSTIDPGPVPEFIQRIVARNNLPRSVRALGDYVASRRNSDVSK